MLPRLLDQHPDLRMELEVSDKVVDIVGEGFDLALRVAPLVDSELIARCIAPNPRVMCASPQYIKQHGRPARLADLEKHQCVILRAVPRWPFMVDRVLEHCQVNGRVFTNSVEAVRRAAVQGLGIAQLAYWDVFEHLRKGTLVEIELSDASPEQLSVWAVTPTRRQVPARVKAFLQMLELELEGLGAQDVLTG